MIRGLAQDSPHMPDSFKYKAFISYSHQDKKVVNWLHKKLETYRVPKSLVGKKTTSGVIDKRLYPIFRDREELPTSNELGVAIEKALENSKYLIVVCSPNSAKSRWVNEEIKYFKRLGRKNKILSFIIDGETNIDNGTECFPEALKHEFDDDGNLTSTINEPIAADSREGKDGKVNALIKLIAGLIGVGFDELKQRDQSRQQRRLVLLSVFSLLLVAIMAALTLRAVDQQTEAERHQVKAISSAIAAEKSKKKAEKAGLVSSRLKREAEWMSYVYQINLASSKINQGDIITAENILWGTNPKFRNWEWGRLILDADRSLLTVNLHEKQEIFHSGHVESAAFSPDGNIFLAAGSGGQIKIWNTASGKILQNFNDGKNIIKRIAFSPDGSKFISSSDNGLVKVWKVESGEKLTSISIPKVNKNGIIHLSFLKKSEQIVIGTNDGFIRFYNHRNGELNKEISFPDFRLNHVDFSPNETKIVTSHDQGIFKITNLASGVSETFPIHNEKAKIFFSVYAPKGGNIFTTNSMRSLIFWDPINKVISHQNSGQFKNLTSASFSPNGNFLGTACSDGTVQLWDNWRKTLISNTKTHALSLTGIDFHPDNKRFLTSSEDGKVRLWSRQPQDNIINLESDPFVNEVSVSPDNSMALIVGRDGKRIDLWDTQKSIRDSSFAGIHEKTINHSVFSPCGENFITASNDNTSIIWNIKERKILHSLRGHKNKVNFSTYSPDGKLIATASADKSVIIWNAKSAKQISILPHDESVIKASFDLKGVKLVTCDIKQKTTVWDLNKCKIITVGPNALNSVTFSPDGQNILSTSKYSKIAKIWNPDSGKTKFTLKGHLSFLNSAYFSNDGQRIVTTSNDDTIRIWDSKKGDELITLNYGKCDFAKFSPNDQSLIIHRKYGNGKGINIFKALDFSLSRSQYEAHKQERYLKWQSANKDIAFKNQKY